MFKQVKMNGGIRLWEIMLKMQSNSDVFAYQELLPSENTLIQTYHCSRNTLRRAVSRLVTDGYVQFINCFINRFWHFPSSM